MTDKILSDEEKDALLDGVSSGEVEVHSASGPLYANVEDFHIADRCRLQSNSFPRLQRLNHRLATRIAKQTEELVSAETEIEAAGIRTMPYGEYCDKRSDHCLIVEFGARPLEGNGLVVLNAELVEILVQAFYGGGPNDTPREVNEFFTRGEITVARRFCNDLFTTVAEVWQPLLAIEHELKSTHLGSDIIEGLDPSDRVICADFDISFLQQKQSFTLLWPTHMLASLLPVFEGQKRERDPLEDARWATSIGQRLTRSSVCVSSRVGNASLTLRQVANLKPGDVIDIESPRDSTLYVQHVPILQGQFGVHEGRYAIEASQWLGPQRQD